MHCYQIVCFLNYVETRCGEIKRLQCQYYGKLDIPDTYIYSKTKVIET